jgi:membrane fusion protein, adhesin transport system
VRVRTNSPGFGEDKPVIPGMTTQVDILTGKKTILEYLLRPLLIARSKALTER